MGDTGRSIRKNLLKKAGLPRHVKDMSKEQLEATLRKKRECNAKALKIVEQMLDRTVPEDWFLEQLQYIDEGHFQDIIEERSLIKYCGYPLCAESLKCFSKQQYHISTKCNKVYDITERKKFCSNQCYKAGKFIQGQLLTSPLWLRDKEDIHVFKVLPVSSEGPIVGEEISFDTNEDKKLKVSELSKSDQFVSVSDFTQKSLSQMSRNIDVERANIKLHDKRNENLRDKSNLQSNIPTNQINSPDEKCTDTENSASEENVVAGKSPMQAGRQKNSHYSESLVVEGIPKVDDSIYYEEGVKKTVILEDSKKNGARKSATENEINKQKYDNSSDVYQSKKVENSKPLKQKERREQNSKNVAAEEETNFIIHIEKCLCEWFTLDTLCFLLGEEKVKEMIRDKGECIKEYYKAVNNSSWDPIIHERYKAICTKLKIMEIEEKQLDDQHEVQKLKPLPDYSILKEESQNMELKIQAFYQGKTDFQISTKDKVETSEAYTPSCVLPLIDIHAQNALRRRMVLDNFKRVLPDQLRTFGLSSRDVSSDVRNLVSTFSLSASNITFKPTEWSLLSLVIIKMLSLKDLRLKMLLETEQGIKYQTMMLMAFQQDGGYLERLMVWLTDLDNIMKKQKP